MSDIDGTADINGTKVGTEVVEWLENEFNAVERGKFESREEAVEWRVSDGTMYIYAGDHSRDVLRTLYGAGFECRWDHNPQHAIKVILEDYLCPICQTHFQSSNEMHCRRCSDMITTADQ